MCPSLSVVALERAVEDKEECEEGHYAQNEAENEPNMHRRQRRRSGYSAQK